MGRTGADQGAATQRGLRPGLTRRGLLASAVLAAGCRPGGPDPARLPEPVRAFHRQSRVFDLHVDTLLWHRLLGYDPLARHEPLPGLRRAWHMDLPRARDGGLDGAVLGLVIAPRRVRPELRWELRLHARLESQAGFEQTETSLAQLATLADRDPTRLALCRTGSELTAAIAAGRFAALAGLEGSHGIDDRLDHLRRAWERGLRMLGLVHFQATGAGYPMTVPAYQARGLTPLGFDLLAEAESLPLVIDLAHLNARGVDDALAVMRGPFVVSHSACRALHDHPRNLTDAQLRSIGDRGGVVGIAAGRSFLGPGGLDAFVAHAEHVARVAGRGAPAIGSDWDGAIVPVSGLEDVRGLPFLTARLLERGTPRELVHGLLGENALRVLTEVLG